MKKRIVFLISLITFLSLCLADDNYRLSNKYVVPKEYSLILELKENAFTDTDSFNGEVNIEIEITDNVQSIELHSKELNLSNVNLTDGSDKYYEIVNNNFESDNITDILRINTQDILVSGTYFLFFQFEGKFSPFDMHGLYKSTYKNSENIVEYLATTQLEPTHARRIFPCFDEPALKAVFQVTIISPVGYNALSNGMLIESNILSDNRTETKFAKTPKMSTYLNAFIISKFTCTEGTRMQNNIVHQVCSRNETTSIRSYALDVGTRIMNVLNEFTNITYSIPGKMDQVAIPDFSAGAMENWGLVTYRETGLLWDENDSTNINKQRLAAVVAHEFAHMWFGNLVTNAWWSDVFLQEGFARYFQYFATALVEEDMELEKQFVIEQVQGTLLFDSSENVSPLSSNVSSPSEISGKFNSISYGKGASIYRMIEHFIGQNNFRTGFQNYLLQNSESSTVPSDLWNQFSNLKSLPYSFNDIMENWTFKQGYPVITVKIENKTVYITQEQILISGVTTTTKWYVPISYTLSTENIDKFTNTDVRIWLSPHETETKINLENETAWIILNNQQTGYYRTYYEEKLLNNIINQMNTSIDSINDLSRSQIVDDLFYFARAEKLELSLVLNAVRFLRDDLSYYSWYSAITGYSYFLQRIANPNVYEALSSNILQLMDKFYQRTAFTENPNDHGFTLQQVLAVNWACKLGNSECIEKSKNLFQTYKTENKKPYKNLRAIIYCTALRHSNDEEDFNFLWNEFIRTNLATEEVLILGALGCSKNSALLKTFLNKTFEENGAIRRQDLSAAISSVYNGNPSGVDVTYEFIFENIDKVLAYYKTDSAFNSLVQTLAARITSQKQIDKLQEIYEKVPEKLKPLIESSITTGRSNLNNTRKIETAVNKFLKSLSSHATTHTPHANILYFIIINCILIFMAHR